MDRFGQVDLRYPFLMPQGRCIVVRPSFRGLFSGRFIWKAIFFYSYSRIKIILVFLGE